MMWVGLGDKVTVIIGLKKEGDGRFAYTSPIWIIIKKNRLPVPRK